MPDDADNKDLTGLSSFSKPVEVLIDKISNAVGLLYKPTDIVRTTFAEAQANEIKAVSDIRITEMRQRAANRMLAEATREQHNMESIVAKALPDIREAANPSNIEDDWLANFFDKSRLISNEQMQKLWAKLLAEEANSPGAYSKRTVNLLNSLDKSDAELFTSLCRFAWHIQELVPLIYNPYEPIYEENMIDFDSLTDLGSIGLIIFGSSIGYKQTGFSKEFDARYYETLIHIEFPSEPCEMGIGNVFFTKSGQELATLCNSEPIPSFLDYVLDKWRGQNLITSSLLEPLV